jgi:hypothetical protein
VSNSATFCGVAASGAASGYGASGSGGVLPCFRIAAQEAEADDDES